MYRKRKFVKYDIESLIDQKFMKNYILNNNNAIVVMENPNKKSLDNYIMIHYRLKDNKLVEVNRWNQRSYWDVMNDDSYIIRKFHLFMVQGSAGKTDSIYDFKNDKFIVEKGIWDCIGSSNNSATNIKHHLPIKNYLIEYNAFLAYFTLSSTQEENDYIFYENTITNEDIKYSFNYTDGIYFAFLNVDGTIRGNKLFKGKNFSRIEKIIDLNEYSSLEDFKKERIQILNQKKKQAKENYYKNLEKTNKNYVSPYLDAEVEKVLKKF